MKIDLHIHSSCSDGNFPPGEIINQAAAAGLAVISITDHDTTEQMAISLAEAEKKSLGFIPGVEFSTTHEGQDVHILGYALDFEHPHLKEHLGKALRRRFERAYQILDLLEGVNVSIPTKELDCVPSNQIIGRPFIARLLMKYRYVDSISAAFERYLRRDAQAYVPYKLASAQKVIELIAECGGISILAHPTPEELDQYGSILREFGLMGVECFRPQLTSIESFYIERSALEMGMVLTGGSDWHGNSKFPRLGDYHVESKRIGPFLEMARERCGTTC